MSEAKVYRIIRGSIKLSRATTGVHVQVKGDFLMQGDLLPVDMFSAKEIQSWLVGGRIELAGESTEVASEAVEQQRVRASNPFRADPSTLVGKSLEDLLMMVLEIQEDYDMSNLETEVDAVRLLTSGWDPKYTQTVAPVSDRSRPEALAFHKLAQEEGGGSVVGSSAGAEMSAKAAEGLQAAKAAAEAPVEEAQ